MVRSEIISELSKKIGQKLNKPELEKIFQLILNAIIEGIKEQLALSADEAERLFEEGVKLEKQFVLDVSIPLAITRLLYLK